MFARRFFDFSVADLARHQLMNLRTIPDFAPSPESYAPPCACSSGSTSTSRRSASPTAPTSTCSWRSISGLVDQQWANDPGGTRWARLIDRAVEMYANELHLPRNSQNLPEEDR